MLTLLITLTEHPVSGEIQMVSTVPPPPPAGIDSMPVTANEAEEAEFYNEMLKMLFDKRDCSKSGGSVVEKPSGPITLMAENPVVFVMQMIELMRHSGKEWPEIAGLMAVALGGNSFRELDGDEFDGLKARVAEMTGQGNVDQKPGVLETTFNRGSK